MPTESRPRRLLPLSWKLFAAFALVGLTAPLLAAGIMRALLWRATLAQAHASLGQTAVAVAQTLGATPDLITHVLPPANASDRRLVQTEIQFAARASGATVSIVDAGGRWVFAPPKAAQADVAAAAERVLAGEPLPYGPMRLPSRSVVMVGLPICPAPDQATPRTPHCLQGTPLGAVIAFRTVQDLRAANQYSRQVLVWSWLSASILALLFSLVLAQGITRPLRAMASAAEGISRGDFRQRVPQDRDDEIGQLASSFNRMAERLDRVLSARRELLAAVSHELRTPMTSIQGFVAALRDRLIPAGEVDRTYAIIQDEIARLRRLIEDLFELSKLEAGQTKLQLQVVPAAELVQAAADRGRILSGGAGAALAVEAGPGAGSVEVDPDRVVQVLGNFLQNALRFTPAEGRITLRVGDAGGDRVRFEVEDTGGGIPPGEIDRVFDRFYTGDPSRSRPGAGTGLGLSIAREIVRAHGGQIGVDSAVGRGSRFWFELPRRAARAGAPGPRHGSGPSAPARA